MEKPMALTLAAALAAADAWVYVPTGTCDKIVGGSAQPKQS
jgi:hypothetical protein